MALRIHHLNCGSLCPHGGSLLGIDTMVCHCLLLETRAGLVLVDTGIGSEDITDPSRLGKPFVKLLRPTLDFRETALAQVQALGFHAHDVRHIVVTHLDLDHAGGLPDFPKAQVHVHLAEHEAAMAPRLRERARYRSVHFRHQPDWVLHRESGERWLGFDAIRALPGTEDEVLLVPLHGHTRGHCGVAVRSDQGWLLHAGDAYFHHGEVALSPRCPPIITLFENLVQVNRRHRVANAQRLRELVQQQGDQVTVFCAHDPHEMPRAQN